MNDEGIFKKWLQGHVANWVDGVLWNIALKGWGPIWEEARQQLLEVANHFEFFLNLTLFVTYNLISCSFLYLYACCITCKHLR